MRILIVGDGTSDIHEIALSKAFQKIGCKVDNFLLAKYYYGEGRIRSLKTRIQVKFHLGPLISKINTDLLKTAGVNKYDIIFIYRGINIYPTVIKSIKKLNPRCKLICYNNDCAFSKGYNALEWRHYLNSLPFFDIICVYRSSDIKLVKKLGCKNVILLRSWFIPWLDFPPAKITKTDLLSYKTNVVFAGHYENDTRLNVLESLVSSGVELKLFGPYKGLGRSGWQKPIKKNSPLYKLTPIQYLQGNDYRKAIFLSDISLCFLSKLNNDTYTRRCFEIPAIGGALFSEHSNDLATLFKDGKEAVFFKNKEDLICKVKYYLQNPTELKSIKENGNASVKRNGHDVVSRATYLLNSIN